ncbi:MAG: hypothetical protein ACE5KZ_06140 [Candidatus Scalinduaceae bacterium]
MPFIEYKLTSDILYLGDRSKGGIFKPCVYTIPFSQISGALNSKFGLKEVKAVGYLLNNSGFNRRDYLIYSPRDRNSGTSKVPLQVEFITNVMGKVFILKNNETKKFPERFEISMGGLRSKGFGRCYMAKQQMLQESEVAKGELNVRIPLEEQSTFNIRKVERPVYGYLFKPIPNTFTGNYVLSVFEGSEVIAPKFLVKDERR